MQRPTRLAAAAGIALFSLAVSPDLAARDAPIACADLATRYHARDVLISTRPHCPYPQEAVYDGVGDPNQAASYSCQKLN